MFYLSQNFTLEELTFSQTAARKGINNIPSEDIISNLKRTAQTLEQIRSLANKPLLISSGYRSPILNKVVGGAKNSSHLLGLAADINIKGVGVKDFAIIIAQSQLEFDQLIVEYDSWVHIGLSIAQPRRQLLTIRKDTGYLSGLV